MGMRLMMGVFGMGLLFTMSSVPSAWAADGDATAEAASVEPVAVDAPAIEGVDTTDTAREHILQEIEAVRQTDPELAAEMEEQLKLLDSGQLDLTGGTNVAFTAQASEGTTGLLPGSTGLQNSAGPQNATGRPGAELIGPPTEGTGGGMPEYMTPELRDQLFNVFDGVGRGELTEDQARGQAEAILREHGIDPREMGQGHEGFERDQGNGEQRGGSSEGMERAFEQMSPEGREQMERFFESEGSSREFEGQTHEQMEREFETLQREYELAAPESPAREFESSQREYEAPQGYEAPEREYQMPEQQQYERPPQP